MTQLPGAIFIIDPKREHLAVHEAQRLGITTIAMVDSNTDPTPIDIVLPANDDAIRSIRLITAGIAQAAIVGRLERESMSGEDGDLVPMPLPQLTISSLLVKAPKPRARMS